MNQTPDDHSSATGGRRDDGAAGTSANTPSAPASALVTAIRPTLPIIKEPFPVTPVRRPRRRG